MTAFKGEFSDFKIVKTRSVCQIVLEIPLEQADDALAVLGGVPRPDRQVWVAVARLGVDGGDGEPQRTVNPRPSGSVGSNPTPPTSSDGARGQDIPEKPVSSQTPPRPAPSDGERIRTRAVMLCKDERFRHWLGLTRDDMVDAYVRNWCAIQSRAELATNPEAQKRFLLLEAQYRAEVAGNGVG